MSSSLAAPVTTNTTAAPASASTAATIASQSSHLIAGRNNNGAANASGAHPLLPHPIPSQFREIHKNTWLKRLTADGKKITVGAKKSERSWVVFCVHDDTIALLEGYAEPRQTGAHMPEWIISLQDTLHISHGLIPNSHEFEFVVTLSNEVIRFHAMSWDIMQEWVSTLRSKLREMKIISPRENIYTKLPEVRIPLLPTRDPTSPLPAPPPVPAAIVPGIERVVTQSTAHQQETPIRSNNASNTTIPSTTSGTFSATTTTSSSLENNTENTNVASTSTANITAANAFSASTPNITAMSNTLTQNLLNMLSDPITAYSEQINDGSTNDLDSCSDDLNFSDDEFLAPILRKSCAQLLQCSDSSVRLDVEFGQERASADHVKNLENLLQCERLIPRPQTSRSQSVGAVDKSKSKKQDVKRSSHSNDFSKVNPDHSITPHAPDNITELEICNAVENLHLNDSNTANARTVTTETESNITIIQVSTTASTDNTINEECNPPQLLPKKQLQAEVFKFPEALVAVPLTTTSNSAIKQHEYKSNVQIIPSNTTNTANNSNNTIQVLTQESFSSAKKATAVAATAMNSKSNTNQYSNPNKNVNTAATGCTTNTTIFATNNQKVTTVHVAGNQPMPSGTSVSIYGTCYTPSATATAAHNEQAQASTPKLPKKIILTANAAGITNITVNNNDHRRMASGVNDKPSRANVHSNNLHYEKVFLASNVPVSNIESHGSSTAAQAMSPKPHSSNQVQQKQPTMTAVANNSNSSKCPSSDDIECIDLAPPTSPRQLLNANRSKTPISPRLPSNVSKNKSNSPSHSVSPAVQRRRIVSPPTGTSTPLKQQVPAATRTTAAPRNHVLTRGLTEAAIVTRPSRKDLYNMKLANAALKSSSKNTSTAALSNNNEETLIMQRAAANAQHHILQQPLMHPILNRTNSELIEQRRRSSSTSDAQVQRVKAANSTTNNNELHARVTNNALRIQQPPMPFRGGENGMGCALTAPNSLNNSPTAGAGKRMTLREQQVMQLRREIMHPGGVRLQLRRKDCIGSIAWVDAFGAVWVAGWKQKEHPVLYNALHIGDQLISIAGITISTAAEANKIIRNTNTLFVEVLVRRIPFGRGHAIRREREGQCLGLIRDGNTATIVDVVPNSLAARHGLPPKAQSCDGTTLTFWVLTEINGRPLNLFFKENEIRDRLNSVGRDISILVQPSDLITKLKKQLKSLRGYKDYLVQ